MPHSHGKASLTGNTVKSKAPAIFGCRVTLIFPGRTTYERERQAEVYACPPCPLGAGDKAVRRASDQVVQSVAIFEGEVEEAVGAFQRKLAGDVCAVRLDRAGAYKQFGSDFFRGFLLCNGFEDAAFGGREVGESRRVGRERFGAISAAQQKAG